MQAWIPVVTSRLYFWKSVFSFQVDSILKWRVYIKLKVSWLRAFLWCMSQTSRDRVNSRCVLTHEKNSGDAVRRLGTIIQSIFCAQSGASIRSTVWKWSGESRYQGLFRLCLKPLSRLFSRPHWPPPGLRGCTGSGCSDERPWVNAACPLLRIYSLEHAIVQASCWRFKLNSLMLELNFQNVEVMHHRASQ